MNTLDELKRASNFDNIKNRILSKVIKSNNDCLEYSGKRDGDGYSSVSIYINKKQYKVGGHRLIHILSFGDIPKGHVVMHSCDNPCCVNINHLSTGTVKNNIHDCILKGRYTSGGGSRECDLSDNRKKAIANKEKTYHGSTHSCCSTLRSTANGECILCRKLKKRMSAKRFCWLNKRPC